MAKLTFKLNFASPDNMLVSLFCSHSRVNTSCNMIIITGCCTQAAVWCFIRFLHDPTDHSFYALFDKSLSCYLQESVNIYPKALYGINLSFCIWLTCPAKFITTCLSRLNYLHHLSFHQTDPMIASSGLQLSTLKLHYQFH